LATCSGVEKTLSLAGLAGVRATCRQLTRKGAGEKGLLELYENSELGIVYARQPSHFCSQRLDLCYNFPLRLNGRKRNLDCLKGALVEFRLRHAADVSFKISGVQINFNPPPFRPLALPRVGLALRPGGNAGSGFATLGFSAFSCAASATDPPPSAPARNHAFVNQGVADASIGRVLPTQFGLQSPVACRPAGLVQRR